MYNPNFAFLKEKRCIKSKYRKFADDIYNDCKEMDFNVIRGQYVNAMTSANNALETIVKTKYNIDDSDHTNLGKHIARLSKDEKNKDIINACDNIRKSGNIRHQRFEKIDKNKAEEVAKNVHDVVVYYLYTSGKLPEDPIYTILDEDSKWFKEEIGIPELPINDTELKEEMGKMLIGYLIPMQNQIAELENQTMNIKDSNEISMEITNQLNNLTQLMEEKNDEKLSEMKETIIKNVVAEISNENRDNIEPKFQELMEIVLNRVDEKTQDYDIKIKEDIQKLISKIEDTPQESEELQKQLGEIKKVLSSIQNEKVELDLDNDLIREIVEEIINENKEKISSELEKDVESVANKFEYTTMQKRAIRSKSPRLIIDAGPGAGKTEVLTKRVEFLVKNLKKDPKSLLVITFTEKAANELKLRLKEKLDIELIDQMQISTIHSFCISLLSEYMSSGVNIIDDKLGISKLAFIKKYKNELGFTEANYITEEDLKVVSEVFQDFAVFGVDYKGLLNHVNKEFFTKPKHLKHEKQYMDLINKVKDEMGENFEFPLNIVTKNAVLRQRWYLHKYRAIVKAYSEYLKLQDKMTVYDYDHLQIRAREFLKESRVNIKYKNILIDEFQDTDVVQFEIFNLLLENSETFTAVGDKDQSIYSFRGARPDFFEKYVEEAENGNFAYEVLDVNFRSTKNIVEFNENFYKDYRSTDDEKITYSREEDGNLYYLNNTNKDEQASNIVSIIKYLKESGKVKKLSDIGLLFRSIKDFFISELLAKLKEEDIDYTLKGAEDFGTHPEVEAILILLQYLTNNLNDFFDLKNFTRKELNDEVFHFSEKTLEVLKKYESSGDLSLFNEDELIDLGIAKEDVNFFIQLNNLKSTIHDENTDIKLTILDAYYKLLEITNYVDNKLEDNKNSKDKIPELENIALISRVIGDFMDKNDRFDINQFVPFLYAFYNSFDSPADNIEGDDKVQISTIHKSKGLEYPVVFLCGVTEGILPKEGFKVGRIESDLKNYRKSENYELDYPIPLDYTAEFKGQMRSEYSSKYKDQKEDEQFRLVYVAMTRARDTLIVSGVKTNPKNGEGKVSTLLTTLKSKSPNFMELTEDNLDDLKYSNSRLLEDKKELDLSFSSFENYKTCPHKYNLIDNYGFKTPENKLMHIGTVIHKILEKIHKLAIKGLLTMENVELIIKEALDSNPDLIGNERFNESLDAVREYVEEKFFEDGEIDSSGNGNGGNSDGEDDEEDLSDWNIIDSELFFTIQEGGYNLTGQVDLIINDSDGDVTLVDFKTTDLDSVEDNIKKHKNQLHIYYLALKDREQFVNKISNLMIYSVNDNEEEYLNLDEYKAEELLEELNDVANDINDQKFDKNIYGKNNLIQCETCAMFPLCNIKKLFEI